MTGNKGCISGTVAILIAGIVLIIAGVVLSVIFFLNPGEEKIDWTLTLVGTNGQEKVLSYDEIKDLPSVKVRGGFFSTVGVVYGPYDIKGVPVKTICDLVGGFTADDILFVSAQDGYSSVYDYDQVYGNIDTFTSAPIKLKPHTEIQFILMYEQDGQPLTQADGWPLRLAIACPDELITEGHWWVRWVDRIEIRNLPEN